MKEPTSHDHGNCELCDALEQERENFLERISYLEKYIAEIKHALNAKSTPWQVNRKLEDGNFRNEQILKVEQGPDGVRITI